MSNRCVLDSVLWFHLECPRAVAKFDNPMEFKRKVRDFLAEQRTNAENILNMSPEDKRIKDEYAFTKYPEDVKEVKELRQFKEIFKQYDPERKPDEDFDNEEPDEMDEDINIKESDYGKRPDWAKIRPIRKDESLKHRA